MNNRNIEKRKSYEMPKSKFQQTVEKSGVFSNNKYGKIEFKSGQIGFGYYTKRNIGRNVKSFISFGLGKSIQERKSDYINKIKSGQEDAKIFDKESKLDKESKNTLRSAVEQVATKKILFDNKDNITSDITAEDVYDEYYDTYGAKHLGMEVEEFQKLKEKVLGTEQEDNRDVSKEDQEDGWELIEETNINNWELIEEASIKQGTKEDLMLMIDTAEEFKLGKKLGKELLDTYLKDKDSDKTFKGFQEFTEKMNQAVSDLNIRKEWGISILEAYLDNNENIKGVDGFNNFIKNQDNLKSFINNLKNEIIDEVNNHDFEKAEINDLKSLSYLEVIVKCGNKDLQNALLGAITAGLVDDVKNIHSLDSGVSLNKRGSWHQGLIHYILGNISEATDDDTLVTLNKFYTNTLTTDLEKAKEVIALIKNEATKNKALHRYANTAIVFKQYVLAEEALSKTEVSGERDDLYKKLAVQYLALETPDYEKASAAIAKIDDTDLRDLQYKALCEHCCNQKMPNFEIAKKAIDAIDDKDTKMTAFNVYVKKLVDNKGFKLAEKAIDAIVDEDTQKKVSNEYAKKLIANKESEKIDKFLKDHELSDQSIYRNAINLYLEEEYLNKCENEDSLKEHIENKIDPLLKNISDKKLTNEIKDIIAEKLITFCYKKGFTKTLYDYLSSTGSKIKGNFRENLIKDINNTLKEGKIDNAQLNLLIAIDKNGFKELTISENQIKEHFFGKLQGSTKSKKGDEAKFYFNVYEKLTQATTEEILIELLTSDQRLTIETCITLFGLNKNEANFYYAKHLIDRLSSNALDVPIIIVDLLKNNSYDTDQMLSKEVAALYGGLFFNVDMKDDERTWQNCAKQIIALQQFDEINKLINRLESDEDKNRLTKIDYLLSLLDKESKNPKAALVLINAYCLLAKEKPEYLDKAIALVNDNKTPVSMELITILYEKIKDLDKFKNDKKYINEYQKDVERFIEMAGKVDKKETNDVKNVSVMFSSFFLQLSFKSKKDFQFANAIASIPTLITKMQEAEITEGKSWRYMLFQDLFLTYAEKTLRSSQAEKALEKLAPKELQGEYKELIMKNLGRNPSKKIKTYYKTFFGTSFDEDSKKNN